MKLAYVTNWNERCGNAEYAANLVNHVRKHADIDLKIVGRPLNFEHIYAETRDADLIHFNCVTPEFRSIILDLDYWPKFRDGGKCLTMTLQDNTQTKTERVAQLVYRQNQDNPWSRVFDCIAVHAKSEGAPYPSNVRVIPHGLLKVDTSKVKVEQKIGTAGFPMPWKGFVRAAEAAKLLGVGYLAVMPASHHIDVEQTKRKVLEIHPDAEVITDWIPHEEIIARLAECFVNVYPYDLSYPGREFEGISGAIRFGLSAGRPLIASRCCMFRDLLGYPDEVYFMDDGLEKAIAKVADDWNHARARFPFKIIKDMNWDTVACKYLEMWAYVANHWVVAV